MGLNNKKRGINGRKRSLGVAASLTLSALLAACSSSDPVPTAKKGKFDPKYGVSASLRVANNKKEFRKGGGHYKVGRPYKVAGKTYVPKEQPNYNRTGKASWYGDDFHGRLTANGEIFDMNTLTAAHPTLPLPSYARVTNLKNGRSVIVRINDRGPYAHNRIIDLSKRTAEVLNFKHDGITKVRVKYIGKARMDGQDERYLEASYRRKGQRIGNDYRAVPKEGERRAPPQIMVASAKPAQIHKTQKPARRQNYLLAHVPAFQVAKTSAFAAPAPAALAARPTSGWAPIDLTGEGYHPPAPSKSDRSSLSLAQSLPVALYYLDENAGQRVSQAHQAIQTLITSGNKPELARALAKRMGKNSDNTRVIGSYSAAYALRLGKEFASLGAVQLDARQNGAIQLSLVSLKVGVSWKDIENKRRELGL